MNRLYEIPFFGEKLLGQIVKREGGPQKSTTLRKITNNRYKVDIGMFTYGGCFASTFNYGNGGTVKIGKYCSFSSDIHYFAANHPVNLFSMSPYFFRREWGFEVADVERAHLEIGNDVWIGYGVLITSGCRYIGNGAVIAAGSILTKDVPPYSVVGGCPGRIIRSRFDNETINLLEKSQWWDLQPECLIKFYKQSMNPKRVAELIIEFKRQKME